MHRRKRFAVAGLLAVAGLAACAGAQAVPAAPVHRHPMPVHTIATDTPRFTAADVRFMSGMIGHHAQAVQMAQLAPGHGASAEIRTLAARIINAQVDEMAIMRQWLGDHGQPVPDEHAGHGDHHALMPGMLTAAQLQELNAAQGAEFDRLFLTYMIQHHRGAVAMVTELFGSYGAGQDEVVFKFASDVNVDQATEIARMQRMLANLMFPTQ